MPGRARPAVTLPAPPAAGLEGLAGSARPGRAPRAASPARSARELSPACWFVADLIHTNWILPRCWERSVPAGLLRLLHRILIVSKLILRLE